MRPKLYHILLLLTGLIVLSGCNGERKWRIGVSQCSSDDWRNKMNEEIQREALILPDNVEIVIRSADDSNETQIADLQYFLDNDFDLIAVAPNSAEALTPIVTEIYQSGKPVIIFDRSIEGDAYTAFQGAKNESIGDQAALLAFSYVGKGGKVLEIEGLNGSSPAYYRKQGFHERADSLDLNIVASADGRWNYEDARRVTDSLLNIYSDIDVIYAHNDRMAIGASEVLTQRGQRQKVKVIGIDAAPNIGIKAVADGTIDATFIYPTEGESLVQTAMAILKGEDYTRINLFPTPSAVDKTNAEIVALQNQALANETGKIVNLQSRIDEYWKQHSIQTALLYASIIMVVLLSLVVFLLFKAYWNNKKHRQEMEQRNAELQRQRDELDGLYHKLEEATRSKLTFFTNVSHDLRTPLTLIADPVQQLSDANNLTPRQHTLMQLANKSVKTLLRLVNQILDIRKYDNGHLALSLSNIDIAGAMREWMAPFAEAASKRHLRFSLEIQPNADYVTAIDPDKIERVLFNLISNAFKFTPSNGKVSVTLSRDANDVYISVTDNGIGIKPEEIPQVFDRFFKNSGAINPNGSGIGLALSKMFVEMHDGKISVESTPGQGTVFKVQIPVKRIDAPEAALPTVNVATADADELATIEENDIEVREDAPTILVIDDNPDISTLVKSILGDDFTVIRACTGTQGIRMASKYIPDLIISDVMMPGIDGYETCRRLKGEQVTSHIPVLLLTACSLEQQRTEAYECGADGYMSKPFDSAMLKARCKSLIDNRKRMLGKPAATTKETTALAALPKHDIDDEFYGRFIQVVERNLGNSELSVEDIAAELGLSRVQMYRKIKALTNYSPAEILRNTRLEQAARLLKTTERTVSEIAYECGFTSPGYFAKCYKEYFKESPTETQARTSRLN